MSLTTSFAGGLPVGFGISGFVPRSLEMACGEAPAVVVVVVGTAAAGAGSVVVEAVLSASPQAATPSVAVARSAAVVARGLKWLPDLDEVDDEHERLVGCDRADAALAVAERRRDDERASPALAHARHAVVPALDDAAGAEREVERRATIPGRVELRAVGEGDADVVHRHMIAGLGGVALADDDVVGDELVGGRAGRLGNLGLRVEVVGDLWRLEGVAHARDTRLLG